MVHPTFENRKEDIYVNNFTCVMRDGNSHSVIATGGWCNRHITGDFVDPVIPGTGYYRYRVDLEPTKKEIKLNKETKGSYRNMRSLVFGGYYERHAMPLHF